MDLAWDDELGLYQEMTKFWLPCFDAAAEGILPICVSVKASGADAAIQGAKIESYLQRMLLPCDLQSTHGADLDNPRNDSRRGGDNHRGNDRSNDLDTHCLWEHALDIGVDTHTPSSRDVQREALT